MKFNTILYTLVAVSATLANVLPRNDASCIDKINDLYRNNELAKQCFAKVQDPNEEIEDLNVFKSKVEERCNTNTFEKCQKLINDITNLLSTCDSPEKKTLEQEMTEIKMSYNVICSTDESNNACPVRTIVIDEYVNQRKAEKKLNDASKAGIPRETLRKFEMEEDIRFNKVTEKTVNASCKSKSCTDAYVNLFLIYNIGKDSTSFDRYKNIKFDQPFSLDYVEKNYHNYYTMAFLKSDYCIKQQQNTQSASAGNQQQNTQNGDATGNQQNTQNGNTTGNQQNTQNGDATGNQQNGKNGGNQQNAQSSDASTIKYSMMLTILALCFTLF